MPFRMPRRALRRVDAEADQDATVHAGENPDAAGPAPDAAGPAPDAAGPAPDPEGEAVATADAGGPPARPAPSPRLRRRVVALALAVLLCAAASGYGWYARSAAAERAGDTKACLSTASVAAQAIFSYDFRQFDASRAAARRYITGKFAEEYSGTTGTLRATAVKQQAVVQAQVSAVGVVARTGDSITVLVFLNQYRRNAAITGEKLDQSRVVLTMVRSGGQWKVSGATAL